jgi:coenzyme F420-reducing hydrogenase gamma subunit
VWKFASCDGCQLTLLDCEDRLLDIAQALEIAYFPEATRASSGGPYDVSLVEGSITTEADAARIREVRRMSRLVVALGACATAGGVQALRNAADIDDYVAAVYPRPDFIATLATSTPITDHIEVDVELRGCPIAKAQLLETVDALLAGRRPDLPSYSVCVECKRRGVPCVMVAEGVTCLGPATRAGCGAICPRYGRGCYGCFGPAESVNLPALSARWQHLGADEADVVTVAETFNARAAWQAAPDGGDRAGR